MAEENENTGGEPKKSSGTLLFLAILLIGILAGGAVAYFLLPSGGEAETTEESDVEGSGSMVSKDFKIYKLEDFSVNLRDPAGAKILQMDISLEVKDNAHEKLGHQEAAIKDAIILLTSDYTVENLNGLDGKLGLKDDIQLRIDNLLSPSKVERIYFTKFHYN